MRSLVSVAMLALGLPLAAVTQDTGVLRITVVLTDADGNVTPIPRVVTAARRGFMSRRTKDKIKPASK